MIFTWLVVAAGVLLAAGAVLALVRVERGPTMLDRTVALDILTAAIVGAVALEAASSRRVEAVPILVAIALIGFIASVTIARFAAVEPEGEGRVLTREELAVLEAERRAAEEAEGLDGDPDDAGRSFDEEHHGGPAQGEVRE